MKASNLFPVSVRKQIKTLNKKQENVSNKNSNENTCQGQYSPFDCRGKELPKIMQNWQLKCWNRVKCLRYSMGHSRKLRNAGK